MKRYLKNVTTVETSKIDMGRGVRQGLLMFIPLLYGLLTQDFSSALLVTIGTLAHIYVFKGTFTSRIRAVTFATCGLVVSMMLGTLTAGHTLLFGILLLFVAVIPYYLFNTLALPGPSSTFFIIAYSLSSVMPEDPSAFLYRGLMVGIGGVLGILLVYIESKLTGEKPEYDAVKKDFMHIRQLIYHFNQQSTFNDMTKAAVKDLMLSSDILSTTRLTLQKKSSDYQRLTLLHHVAEGIYSELLELNAKGCRPMPPIIVEMIDHVNAYVIQEKKSSMPWRRSIEVPPDFEGLVQLIFKIDEILKMPDHQVKKQVQVKSPLYIKRLRYHLTPESLSFIASMKYMIIIGVAIFIALVFHFERAYWIPLSAHTVLIGSTTIASIERAGARWFGTFIGIGIVVGLLSMNPNIWVIVIVMCVSGALTEMLIGANYALAMFPITVQVILLAGLAQGNLTMMIAIPRLLDTTIGILIAVIGVMMIGQRLASKRLPEIIGKVVRIESQIFHSLFSDHTYEDLNARQHKILHLKLNLENMEAMYRHAYGEWSSNRKRTQYYYPAMFLLQQMHFKLVQGLMDERHPILNRMEMGQYLLVFENIAKHFEYGIQYHPIVQLPYLESHIQIRYVLMQLQEIALYDQNNERNPNLLPN
ncbi:FUSC family protein [Staphylococcus sp. 17KM0847]|uniref:FUSC family protein n=1 Tax=Staphylococcus sp. 17KM0847 TaxID=2583989 RepID=UPI0015DCC6A3|nr:FUSC family protein [Staphylococcus sp. 17KM0847]QLK85316.1 FUSC family protein [Staphylococcus sp. 17KM0847]